MESGEMLNEDNAGELQPGGANGMVMREIREGRRRVNGIGDASIRTRRRSIHSESIWLTGWKAVCRILSYHIVVALDWLKLIMYPSASD